MTGVRYDWGKMARDPKGEKLLRGALKDMVEGWKEREPNDPKLKNTEEIIETGFQYVKKHGTIGEIK